MAKYGIRFQAFPTTTALKSAARLAPAAGSPIEVVYLSLTGAGSVAPADIMHEGSLDGLDGTTAGTLTVQTPERMSPGNGAAACGAGVNATAEPTVYRTVDPILAGFNQRSGMVWGVPRGEGFIAGASQSVTNCGVRVRSNAAGAVDFNLHFWE